MAEEGKVEEAIGAVGERSFSAFDGWLAGIAGGDWIVDLFDLGILILAATLVYFFVRWGLLRSVRKLVDSTSTDWDDELVRAGLFSRLAHIAPAFVVFYGTRFFPHLPEQITDGFSRVAVAVMLLVGALAISSFLTAAENIYDRHPKYRERPIKGYLQVVSILVYLLAGLLILAALMNRSPWIFVSGIGAMTAVLLLVFKDTILSLVASVQIASNDMIRVGDWIEMPGLGADGDVIEVALHTVKVQNWDKTITTIPTHRLISDSFKNWRGMSESGGRRIKRSVSVDLQTVRFLTPEEIETFGKWGLLADYISGKRAELDQVNGDGAARLPVDQRRLTNLGTLRAWIWETLRSHPDLHQQGHTLLVRQLASGPKGVPIEIYCFTNDTAWVRYEDIQADLFDRILAMMPEFGLRVFQEPSGADVASLGQGKGDERGRSEGEVRHA